MKHLRTASATISIAAMAIAASTAAHAQSAPGFYIDGYVQVSRFGGSGATSSGNLGRAVLDFGINPGDYSGIFGVDAGVDSFFLDLGTHHSWYLAATAQFGDTKLSLGRPRTAVQKIPGLRPFANNASGLELAFLTDGLATYLNYLTDDSHGAAVEHNFGATRIAVSAHRFADTINLTAVAVDHSIAGAFSFDDARLFASYERAAGGGTPTSYLRIGAELSNDKHKLGLEVSKSDNGFLTDDPVFTVTYDYNFRPNLSAHLAIITQNDDGIFVVGGEYRFLENGFLRLSTRGEFDSGDQVNDLTLGYRF